MKFMRKHTTVIPENKNAFIETYLDHYRRMANTDFAVLVKGPWGCGKTYFIKRYREVSRKLTVRQYRGCLRDTSDCEMTRKMLHNIVRVSGLVLGRIL